MRCAFILTLALFITGDLLAQPNILLIASHAGYHGPGPFPEIIEEPLTEAGFNVWTWEEAVDGWPPLDTLLAYDAVFFHNSGRRGLRPADTLLTEYVKLNGRLVMEGCDIAQNACVYPEFNRQVSHAKWLGCNVDNFQQEVTDPTHPLVQGVPSTFSASGFYLYSEPDYAVSYHGGRSVARYAYAANSSALIAYPRQAFYIGSFYRIGAVPVRDSLIVNAVNWVLSDPNDCGVIDIDYELGHRSGEPIPVSIEIHNWAPDSRDGRLYLQESTDSTQWFSVDSTDYTITTFSSEEFSLTCTPSGPQLYYLRAFIVPSGADYQPENNSLGIRITTLQEANHPRLFFTDADVANLRLKAQTTHAGIAQALQDQVNEDMAFTFAAPDLWSIVPFSDYSTIVSNAALQAVINPDPVYVEYGKRRALELARYPHWDVAGKNVDSDVNAGRGCAALAMAYDWLYHEFSPAERDTIQIKLYTQINRLQSSFDRYIWWATSFIHAHQWCSVNYLGTAVYGILEEEPDAALWRDRALNNFIDRLSLFGDVDDGSWYESMSYWTYISFSTLPYVYLLREQESIDYFDVPFIRYRAKYRVLASLPTITRMISYNECNHWGGYGPDAQLALLASEYRDSTAQWMRSEIISRIGYNFTDPLQFLFYDPTVPACAPEELSCIFPDQDTYVGRSDWTPQAALVSIKCGLPAGRNAYTSYWFGERLGYFEHSHFHPDAGAITIGYGGDYLVQTPGLQDPVHRTKHSTTILINGQGQVGDSTKGLVWPTPSYATVMNPHLALTFESKTVDYVIGDATTSYLPQTGLTMFERHLIFIRPKLIWVIDRLKASSPSTFSLVLRNESDIFSWDDQRVLLSGNNAELAVFIPEPDAWTAAATTDQVSPGRYTRGVYIDNAVPDTSLRFLTVFYPTDNGEPSVTELASDDTLSAVRLADAEGFEATAAATYGAVDSFTVDSLRTDARLAVVLRDNIQDELTGITVQRGSFLRWGENYPLRYWSPDTLNLNWEYRPDTLAVYGDPPDSTRIHAPSALVVLVNDAPYPYQCDGEFVVLGNVTVPPQAVTDMTIRADGDSVRLQWSHVTLDVYGRPLLVDIYNIYRADSTGEMLPYAQVPGSDSTFADLVAPHTKIVSYEIRACVGDCEQPVLQIPEAAAQPASKTARLRD